MTSFRVGQKIKRLVKVTGGPDYTVYGTVGNLRSDGSQFYVERQSLTRSDGQPCTPSWGGWWSAGWDPVDEMINPPMVPVTVAATARGPLAPANGSVCKRCNMRNQYAAPNQKDGTYVCYQCRC